VVLRAAPPACAQADNSRCFRPGDHHGRCRMMRLLRRAAGFALVIVGVAGIVLVDRYEADGVEGAAAASGTLSAFPQVSDARRISSSWFCPGAAAGDGVTSAFVNISNPGDQDLVASVTFLSADSPEQSIVTVKPRSREQIEFLRGRTVGVVVPQVELIGSTGSVEQQLDFPGGDVTSQCVPDTSSTWFLADGFTAEGSSQRVVITNPYPDAAVVNMTYVTTEGSREPANLQGLIIPPATAKSLSMAELGAQNERRLSVSVVATTGRVVVSRIQHYLGAGRLGYSTTAGTPRALGQWWFTSGRTGPSVLEQLVVHNPGDTRSLVQLTFFGEGITNGLPVDENNVAATPTREIEVPAGETVDIDTNEVADLPKGDHAMVVSVLEGPDVVVEHVLSQQTGGSSFTAVTNGLVDGLLSPVWRLPSGLVGGALNAVAVLNTTATDGTFTVSAFGPGGKVALPGLENVPLGPASVVSLNVPPDVPPGEVIIEATVPVAVQRRMARNHGLVGFSIVGGLPVQVSR
jgi:hypothetical protein